MSELFELRCEREANPQFIKEYVEFRRVVLCPICLSTYTDPVTLTCTHTFCSQCIVSAVNFREACPLCSVEVDKRCISSNDQLSAVWNAVSNFVNLIQPKKFNDQIVTNHVYKARSPVPPSSSSSSAVRNDAMVRSTNEMNIAPPVEQPPVFVPPVDITASLKPGILVNVLSRTWAGINKLGGIGWILATHIDDDVMWGCDVKYVLDNTVDHQVPVAFVELHKELDRTSRRSRHPPLKSPEVENKNNNTSVLTDSGEKRAKKRKAAESAKSTSTAATLENTSAVEAVVPIVILTTAVDPAIMTQLTALTEKFPHVTLATLYTSSVTHLVVSVDRNGVLKKRTMKYMQALVSGLWILSSYWVVDCVAQGRMLPEPKYEISRNSKAVVDCAPRRARVNIMNIKLNNSRAHNNIIKNSTSSSSGGSKKPTNLLENILVLLYGQYPTPGPPRSDLEELLLKGGAVVCVHLQTFLDLLTEGEKKCTHLMVICTNDEFKQEFLSEAPAAVAARVNVLSDTNDTSIRQKQKTIHLVSPLWALDTITNYQVLLPDDYEV